MPGKASRADVLRHHSRDARPRRVLARRDAISRSAEHHHLHDAGANSKLAGAEPRRNLPFFPALFLEEFFQDASFLYRLPFFHGAAGDAARRLSSTEARRIRSKLTAMRGEIVRLENDSVHVLRASLYEMLIMLSRAYAPKHDIEARTVSPLALRYRESVQRLATKRHNVADYARDLAVSPGHLNSICKRHLGRGAKDVIEAQLVVEARRLLLYSGETASRVAVRLGFKDASYFRRFLRRANGCSPPEFRARTSARD